MTLVTKTVLVDLEDGGHKRIVSFTSLDVNILKELIVNKFQEVQCFNGVEPSKIFIQIKSHVWDDFIDFEESTTDSIADRSVIKVKLEVDKTHLQL
jgi:hypothetical protein